MEMLHEFEHCRSSHPVLDLLGSLITDGSARGSAQLWSAVARSGTPIVCQVSGEPRTYQVTYLWRATSSDVGSVSINGAPVWHESAEVLAQPDGIVGARRMHSVPGTDVWWRTFKVPSQLRAGYSFVESRMGDPTAGVHACDPFNSRRWPDAAPADPPVNGSSALIEPRSYVELPEAPPVLRRARPDAPRGETTLHRVHSRLLANTRRVWVWTPPTVATVEAAGLPVLLLHDGWHWTVPGCSIATMMDHLVSSGAVPPMVVVAQESPSGAREELACDPRFVDFLTEELLPWVRARWPVTRRPERTAVAGQSYGGLNAVYSAHRRPDVFGAAISQSGSFWWPGDTPFGRDAGRIMRLYAEEPRPSVRFSLDVGLLEGRMVAVNRHLRDVLVAGGHDWLSWGPAMPAAIEAVTAGWGGPSL